MRAAGMVADACVKPLKSVNKIETSSCRTGRTLPVSDNSVAISTGRMLCRSSRARDFSWEGKARVIDRIYRAKLAGIGIAKKIES